MAVVPNTSVNLATNIRDVLNAAGGSVTDSIVTFFSENANINKWAFHKPEYFKKDFNLTDTDRYNNNHGFDTTYLSDVGIISVYDRVKNGQAWSYKLPQGTSSSPYRLGDFRGYNTDAVAPFDYHYINRSGASVTYPYADSWRVVVNKASEIKMSDLAVFENKGYYMFIARKLENSSYTYIISELVSRSGDPEEIICDISFPSAGTWECVFCMGQDTTEDIDSRTDLVPLPEGYFNVTLSTTAVYINVTYVSPNPPDVTYYEYNQELDLGTQTFQLTLEASDKTAAVPATELRFGWYVALLDSNGYEINSNTVYSSDENDYKTYSGTSAVSWYTINFEQIIPLLKYFDESEITSATMVKLRPEVSVVNGVGIPSMDLVEYKFGL